MLTKPTFSFILLGLLFDSTSAGLLPQERADICGSKGYDRGKGNYFYSDSAQLATYAACSQKCVLDSKCKSFGYNTKECMLFNIALSGNFDANSGSSDIYYDRGCIKSVSTSSSAKTTALPTTSSTSVSSTTKKTSSGALPSSTTTSKPSSSSTKTTAVPGTSTSSSVTSASATVPAGCSVPSPVTITSFSWFNSTHNLVSSYNFRSNEHQTAPYIIYGACKVPLYCLAHQILTRIAPTPITHQTPRYAGIPRPCVQLAIRGVHARPTAPLASPPMPTSLSGSDLPIPSTLYLTVPPIPAPIHSLSVVGKLERDTLIAVAARTLSASTATRTRTQETQGPSTTMPTTQQPATEWLRGTQHHSR